MVGSQLSTEADVVLAPCATCGLALNEVTLPDASSVDVIEAAAAADIRWVGLRLTAALSDPSAGAASRKQFLRETHAALRYRGVGLLQMGAVVLDGTQTRDSYVHALAAGARLGARYVAAFVTESDAHRRFDAFALLCDVANDQGLGVALEFVPYSAVRTVEEAATLVRRSGWPNATVLVDALHLHRSGGSAASLAALPAETISIAQLCDAPLEAPDTTAGLQHEARRGRLDPGDGALPLRDLVAALPAQAFLELEIPNPAYAGRPPLQRVRELAARARRLMAGP